MIRKITVLLLLSVCTTAFGQRMLVGRVIDADTQKPLENVNIVVSGSEAGTFSNRIGFFQMQIKPTTDKILLISHVGYGTLLLPVPKEDKFQVKLHKEFIVLQPVSLLRYPSAPSSPKDDDVRVKKIGDVVVESQACAAGGMNSFYDYMGNSLVNIAGISDLGFKLAFTINEEGRAVDFIFPDSATFIKQEVVNLFDAMPAWKPATQRGIPVPQYLVLPITRRHVVDITSQGFDDFHSFFAKNCKYPVRARRMGAQGQSFVQFDITPSGAVENIRMLKEISDDISSEIMRVVAGIPKNVAKLMGSPTEKIKFVLPVAMWLEGNVRPSEPYNERTDGIILDSVVLVGFGSTY